MLTAIAATFLKRPISIEMYDAPNDWSSITVSSRLVDDPYMDSLTDCVMGFCDWVTSTLHRKADCKRENGQVTCTLQVRWAELPLKVLAELQNRLWRYEDRVAVLSGGGRRMTMQREGGSRIAAGETAGGSSLGAEKYRPRSSR